MTTRNHSLMGQILRYFLLLSFVSVGAMSAVAYFQSRQAIKQALFERLTLTATLKEDELNRWVDDQREEMLAIVNMPGVETAVERLVRQNADAATLEATERYMRDLMTAIVQRHSSLDEILILSPGGRVVFSTQARCRRPVRSPGAVQLCSPQRGAKLPPKLLPVAQHPGITHVLCHPTEGQQP
jgi:hypothetical protein